MIPDQLIKFLIENGLLLAPTAPPKPLLPINVNPKPIIQGQVPPAEAARNREKIITTGVRG